MIFLYTIILCWAVLIALDFGLKIFLPGVYVRFLTRRGITLSPFQVKILSTRTNQFWSRIGLNSSRLWNIWFKLGILSCFILIPISMIILSHNLISYLWPTSAASGQDGQQVLQPVVPGLNVPWKDASYYILSLTFASIVHEAGHALAAASVNVQVEGVGLMIFLLIPAAFVQLPTEIFEGLSPRNQLKVVCAGVWHNLVLVLVSASFILSAPVVLFPFYSPTDGVVVARMANSDLSGKGGLRVNDVIKSINGCQVRDKQDWKRCLIRSIQNPLTGYCLTPQFIEEERFFSLDPDADCCGEEDKRNLCFESGSRNKYCFPGRILLKRFGSETCGDQFQPAMERLRVQPAMEQFRVQSVTERLRVQPAMERLRVQSVTERLRVQPAMEQFLTERMNESSCPPDRCFKPYSVNSNSTKLLVMEREDKDDFLFWGFPGELYSQITITTFKPRSPWIPPSILLHFIDSFLRYTISFSLALGILNVVPCFYLDGHWIMKAIVDLFFAHRLTIDRRNTITNIVTFIGSILVLTSVLIAFTSLATTFYRT